MDESKYNQAVALKKQQKDLIWQRDGMLSSFDSLVANQLITDPEFINLTASLRNNLAGYFDSKIAPLNDQFNAL